MRSSALGTILGALALAVCALLYLKVDQLESRLTTRVVDRPRTLTERDAAGAERRAESGVPGSPAAIDTGGRGLPAGDASNRGAGHPLSDGRMESERGMVERVRELEEEVSRLRAAGGGSTAVRFSAPRFVSSVEDLSKALELSPTQADRIRDSVDRHRRRIEDVLRIPDETGVSPWERRRQEQARMREALEESRAGGVLQFAMGSLMDRNKRIPGQSTTYGEEIARIKSEAREEIATGLDPAQQKSFEDMRIDPLLDEGGGSGFVSISMTSESLTPGPGDAPGGGSPEGAGR